MDLFSRKCACSSSPPKVGTPVRRHASCPLAPKPPEGRAKRRHDMGRFLADLFRPKKLKKAPSGAPRGLIGGGSGNQEEGKAEEKPPLPVEGAAAAIHKASIPLRTQSHPSLSPPELAAANCATLDEPPTGKASPSASIQLPGPSEPMMEPRLLPPKKLALHASIECLPTAGAVPPLPPEPRMFWRTLGKGMKEAHQRWRESKYVQTQPLYQDYWVKRLKAVQRKPQDRAFRVDASLSAAGLLSSSLLTTASHISQRDYSFAFWQELPEVKTRGLLEGIALRQRHLQEAMFEVITSEASYLRSLLVAVLHFQNSPALRGVLSVAELHRLFSNLSQVKDVSERFLLELEEHLDQDVFLLGLGDVVLRHCPAFHRTYIPYVTNQMYQEQLMQQLM